MKLFLLFLFYIAISIGQPMCPSQWTNQLGYYGVQYSGISYCPPDEIQTWTCNWCKACPDVKLIDTYWNESTSTFAYMAYDQIQEQYILAFEGSQDFEDWMIDLEISKLVPYKDHPEVRVHSGFWKAYTSVKEDIYRTLKNYSIDYLFITGHSLGNGLSTLAALDLKEELGVESFMVGFGGPRVGNKAFADYYDTQISGYYRVTHAHDPVVRLPPRILNFHHLGNEIYYPNELFTYKYCPKSEDPECSEGTLFEIWNIWDHTHYLDLAISKCL